MGAEGEGKRALIGPQPPIALTATLRWMYRA